jgi:hypothetical protein
MTFAATSELVLRASPTVLAAAAGGSAAALLCSLFAQPARSDAATAASAAFRASLDKRVINFS